MNTEDALPLADDYAADVSEWLARTDLYGLAEAGEQVELPVAGAPVTVVRPVRLPYEIDALVKALAEARGVSMSSLIRNWITAGLTTAGHVPDPVTELRHSLDVAQRALESLTDRAQPGPLASRCVAVPPVFSGDVEAADVAGATNRRSLGR